MLEFKIGSRDTTSSDQLVGIALLVLGGFLVLVSTQSSLFRPVIEWVGIAGFVAGVFLTALSYGRAKGQKEISFALTDTDLIRRRTGWPEIRLPLSEIRSVSERGTSLVIEGADSSTRISVPNHTQNFDVLRKELSKYHRAAGECQVPSQMASRILPSVVFVGGLSIVCWWLLLFSRDAGVVRGSGVGVLVLLGWTAFYGGRFLRLRHPPRWVSIALLLLWISAVALACYRIVEPASQFIG
jgi:hypothetical protein